MHGLAGAAQVIDPAAHATRLGLVDHLISRLTLRPGRGRERAAVVFVVAAAARLRAHRPEHHADDEARDGRGGDRGNEGAARARPPQAPGRLDGLGVLNFNQFVVLGRRRARGRRLLHGFGFYLWRLVLPQKAAGLPPVCHTRDVADRKPGSPLPGGVQSADLIQYAGSAFAPSI